MSNRNSFQYAERLGRTLGTTLPVRDWSIGALHETCETVTAPSDHVSLHAPLSRRFTQRPMLPANNLVIVHLETTGRTSQT